MHFGGVYHFQNWIQCDRVREGRARPHGCRLASVAQLERSTWQVLKSTALDAVNDHGSMLSYIGVGIRAFFSAQGPGLSSKCSKEVLDRQLVSAVLRSSVRYCCTLACMSCSCRLITSRSVTLARASSRMRRLLKQQQAVRMSLQSCSLITPARSSVCCNTAWVSSKVLRVFVSLCT